MRVKGPPAKGLEKLRTERKTVQKDDDDDDDRNDADWIPAASARPRK